MAQKREYIQGRKRTLLESQQQGQAAAAASQPTMPQLGSSFAASVPASLAPATVSAPPSVNTSAAYTSAMYGASAATSQPMHAAGYPYPSSAAGPVFPVSAAGYGSHMPLFHAGAPRPPAVPAGGPRMPAVSHDISAYPPAAPAPPGPRPAFPGARPPFGAGPTPAVDPSESQKGFEEYGNGDDSGAGSQFLPGVRPPFEVAGARPPFEIAGGRPPFGQRLPFRGPRPGAPSEFGMQAPFQPNQPQAAVAADEFGMQTPFQQNQPRPGVRQAGPRPGFGSRFPMYAEAEETSTDVGDVTESDEQALGMPLSQFGPGFGGPGFGRGMRPGMPGMMGPRAGFPPGPRLMGMKPRQQAPVYSEEADEETEETGEWLGDEMLAAGGADFGLRGPRLEGPRFPTPASGFPGLGDVRGPRPRVTDPRMMLRPGESRAPLQAGLPPRGPRPQQPWLFGSVTGASQWNQEFGQATAEEEYNEDAEAQEGVGEDDGHEEGFGGEFEGDQSFVEGDEGFGQMGFGPHGFPRPPFGGRMPPRFGMERLSFDMRGPRLGFGPRGPGFGFEGGFRPRAGPIPLMDIQLPQSASVSKNNEESGTEQEEENAEEEETEGYTEETDQFAEQAEAASGIGARMPFRPPFPPSARGGFPHDQRFRPPGAMMGVPPRGGRWPRPGFGDRFPGPGFRGPMPWPPRMPGPQPDNDLYDEYGHEGGDGGGGGFGGTGFGDVSEEDYLAAEEQQWGEQQTAMDGQSMELGNAGDNSALAER